MSQQKEKEVKVRFVEGKRPYDIPEDWIIFQSCYPVIGQLAWAESSSFEGLHEVVKYAAIDTSEEKSVKCVKENIRLGATLVKYLSKEEIIQHAKDYLKDVHGYEPYQIEALENNEVYDDGDAFFINIFNHTIAESTYPANEYFKDIFPDVDFS